MEKHDLKFLLALWQIQGLGFKNIQVLLNAFGNAENIFKRSAKKTIAALALKDAVKHALLHPDWNSVEKELTWNEHLKQHIVTFYDEDYPALLKEISNPPLILYVEGDKTLLSKHQLAIVGSRNPSPLGAETAFEFSAHLAKQGLVITSGLALGIDGAGHRGALSVQGNTLGVLGSGLHHIYPSLHKKLAAQIAEENALISEFPLETLPLAYHFPLRNRVISGLSLGTLVVEAASQSGSLITAHCALEQGREVFAIPGSIKNPLSLGSHQLIQQGAKLVNTVDDILDEIKSFMQVKKAPEIFNKDETDLLDCIDFAPTALDQIVSRSGLPVAKVAAKLVHFEILGYVRNFFGGYLRIK